MKRTDSQAVAKQSSSIADQSRRSKPVRGSKKRVLIVDDDPLVRQVSKKLLQGRWEVETASDANEAVELLGHARYDAVLSDFEMPGRDGMWLLAEVRRKFPLIARVMMSGSDPGMIQSRSTPGLIQSFIPKPATRNDILTSLAQVSVSASSRAASIR